MPTLALYHLSGVAAICAGLCVILGSLFSNLVKPEGTLGSAFNFLSALLGLFGITGFYLFQRAESGIFGFIAYVVVFTGLSLIMCIDYGGTFLVLSLSPEEAMKLQRGPSLTAQIVSGMVFLVGAILFGVSVIVAGVSSKIASVFFMIGFLATPLREAYPLIVFAGSVLSGTGLIWWGVSLWL